MNGTQENKKCGYAPSVSQPIGTGEKYANNYKDITNKRFGRLTAVERVTPPGIKATKWKCICDCGNEVSVSSGHLQDGHTQSCGCIRKEILIERHTTHGDSNSPTYSSWAAMLRRCFNKNTYGYKWYGARGVTVSKEWMDYSKFLLDMGEKPSGKEIDRINNNAGYEKGNCRWVTHKENCNNRRNNGTHQINT